MSRSLGRQAQGRGAKRSHARNNSAGVVAPDEEPVLSDHSRGPDSFSGRRRFVKRRTPEPTEADAVDKSLTRARQLVERLLVHLHAPVG